MEISGSDNKCSAVLASLAVAIAAAGMGATVLNKNPESSFPESQVKAVPSLFFDVALQKKCVILNFEVTSLGAGYVYKNWVIYETTVPGDGKVMYPGGVLGHLRFFGHWPCLTFPTLLC